MLSYVRRRPRRLRRASVAVAAAFVMVVLGAAPASAHAQLQSSDPSPSSVLSVPPRQVVLHFGEPVEIDFGSIRVLGPLGNRVDLGGTHHPPGDSDAVAIALPPGLRDGTYVVAWRVISADSHPVHGAYIFSVGTAKGAAKANALAASVNAASGSAIVGIAFWAIRFAAFVGLVLLVGIPTVILLAWRAGGATLRIGRLVWASWFVLMLCTVSGIAVQGVYAAALPVTDVFRSSLFDEVLHTRFGEVEVLRVILLVAFLPVVRGIQGRLRATGRWSSWWVPYGAIVGVGLLLTPGLAGHASTEGSVPFAMALDVLHLSAAAVWCGGLAVLGAVLAPGLRPEERPDDIVRVASTFSAYAFSAVVVIVATGTVQSVRQVGSVYALFNTVYGRTLLVKIGLVVMLIVLGAVSRRIVLGRWWPTLASSRVSGLSAPVLPPLATPSSGSDLVPFARTEPRPMPGTGGAASARRRRRQGAVRTRPTRSGPASTTIDLCRSRAGPCRLGCDRTPRQRRPSQAGGLRTILPELQHARCAGQRHRRPSEHRSREPVPFLRPRATGTARGHSRTRRRNQPAFTGHWADHDPTRGGRPGPLPSHRCHHPGGGRLDPQTHSTNNRHR